MSDTTSKITEANAARRVWPCDHSLITTHNHLPLLFRTKFLLHYFFRYGFFFFRYFLSFNVYKQLVHYIYIIHVLGLAIVSKIILS